MKKQDQLNSIQEELVKVNYQLEWQKHIKVVEDFHINGDISKDDLEVTIDVIQKVKLRNK